MDTMVQRERHEDTKVWEVQIRIHQSATTIRNSQAGVYKSDGMVESASAGNDMGENIVPLSARPKGGTAAQKEVYCCRHERLQETQSEWGNE